MLTLGAGEVLLHQRALALHRIVGKRITLVGPAGGPNADGPREMHIDGQRVV